MKAKEIRCPYCGSKDIRNNITANSLRIHHGESSAECRYCGEELIIRYEATNSSQSYIMDLDDIELLECGVIELFYPERFELRIKACDTEQNKFYTTAKEYIAVEIK